MRLRFFCPRWGSEALSIEEFCAKAKAADYDGIELSLPFEDRKGTERILAAAKASGLDLIAQHWESRDTDLDRHSAEYRAHLDWQAAARPLFINSHTGRDFFSFDDNRRLIEESMEVSAQTGVAIVHETHRGRFAFSAATTAAFLKALPGLRLAADFSHWCVVSESLLEDQGESLDLAIERTDHLHARVGYAEGPQVSDPRAPEFADTLAAHLSWWDRIVARRDTEGAENMTITTEFGPAPYMPALPWTGQPVADQWAINLHMMASLRKRWG